MKLVPRFLREVGNCFACNRTLKLWWHLDLIHNWKYEMVFGSKNMTLMLDWGSFNTEGWSSALLIGNKVLKGEFIILDMSSLDE